MKRKDLFDRLAALGTYERFALVGIAGPDGNGGRDIVHVHAKIMLIDDAWATIGSCNLHEGSLFGHTEMNVCRSGIKSGARAASRRARPCRSG